MPRCPRPTARLEAGPEIAELDAAPITPLVEPADGVPDVVDTAEALRAVVQRFAAGTGPVAADAERASGYRYGQRTYLVQLAEPAQAPR